MTAEILQEAAKLQQDISRLQIFINQYKDLRAINTDYDLIANPPTCLNEKLSQLSDEFRRYAEVKIVEKTFTFENL